MKRYVCGICGYIYDEAQGIPNAGIAPGTRWEDLPAGWKCPLCGAAKELFREADAPEQTAAPKAGTAERKPAGEEPSDL